MQTAPKAIQKSTVHSDWTKKRSIGFLGAEKGALSEERRALQAEASSRGQVDGVKEFSPLSSGREKGAWALGRD